MYTQAQAKDLQGVKQRLQGRLSTAAKHGCHKVCTCKSRRGLREYAAGIVD